MKKLSKKSYEGVCRKVAFLSIVSMLLNVSMIGVFLAPEVKGAPIDEELCEAAVDVVLIMDRSGSMGWEIPTRISQAKNAANDFLGNLGIDDQSAVVSYASEVTLDKELSSDHLVSQTAISNLMAKGGTNIGDAIYLSNQELGSDRTNPQAVKAAILLTDGRATCPYYNTDRYGMCGFVEDEEDIAYTLDAANAAASLGYKVFTIGLGRQYKINEDMLQEVADVTGAEYYYAPSSADLEGIYESIRWQLCEYGSISGCKYNDLDNDGDSADFTTEDTISNWEIILTGETNGPITQLTDEDGCYQFSGLSAGNYTISEGSKEGVTNFVQTYPQDPSSSYSVTLGDEENLTGYDFSNYFPACGNGFLDDGEECDDGNSDNNDSCSNECLNIVDSYCGDGNKQTPNDEGTGGPLDDGNEECDGEDGVGPNQTCSVSCVLLERLCRVKLDAVVVMDRSGSMAWDIPTRLSQAKTAANSFVGKLGSDDRSALVSFSTEAALDKPFSNDHSVTQTMIDGLTAVGATNIGDAIGLANDEFASSVEDVLKMEILMTDGVANKPNGDGFNENSDDVAYAEAKAAEAALAGIKIFTIGLGSDINEVMLQSIADTTGAQYYNAPTADELDAIFTEIAYDICQYGSISGCKYEDSNNDGDITGESLLSDWEITLSGDTNLTQLTNGDGCYSFTGLSGGNYTVSEASEQGVDFIQTYPVSLSYDIVLEDKEEATDYDFGNYFPICGNNILDIGEECDDGNNDSNDGCSASCDIENNGGGSVCGNGVIEGTEECDGAAGVGNHQTCVDCVLIDLTYCGDGIQQTPNDEGTGGPLDDGDEECDDGNADDTDGCNSVCEIITGDDPATGEIVINEVAWMGTNNSTSDEWIELKNMTSETILLDGWTLNAQDGSPEITLEGSISADGYYLLERTDDNTVPNITADKIYSGALGDTGEFLKLRKADDTLVDEVDASDGWPAGDKTDLKYPMERCVDDWYDSEVTGGTPKAENGCGGDNPVCGDGSVEGDEQCDNGNENGDFPGSTCSDQCETREICEGADYTITWWPASLVTGEDCPDSTQTQDSLDVEMTFFWTYSIGQVYGISHRGGVGESEANESFSLQINGFDGLVSQDDPDPNAVTTRFEYLGAFPFFSGTQTIYMNTASQCPPDTSCNSVELDMLCIYFGQDGFSCGNGFLEGVEECDDGNTEDGDGCSSSCDIESDDPVCGDGVQEGNEQCDDGNTDDGDGCSSICELESEEGIGAGDVVINELMWMGSVKQGEVGGFTDEWVELRNMTDADIDLVGCKLHKKNGDEIADLESYSISANGYLVISREDQVNSKIDTATQNILSYQALSNTELKIELRCNEAVIDTAGDGGVPLFGENEAVKKSMSRINIPGDGEVADNWYTASTAARWDEDATELGTPGGENSM